MTRVYEDGDVLAYQRRVASWLGADPVLHAMPASLLAQRVDGTVPVEPDAWWLRVCADDGTLLGVALRTPPYPLLLAAMPAAAAEAVADWCVARPGRLTGVGGPRAAGDPFVARYVAATGARSQLWMAQRMYRLDAVTPPTGVPGAARPAVPAEIPLLSGWVSAFAAETGAPVPDPRLAERIAAGLLWVWTDDERPAGDPVPGAGSPPVAMNWISPPAAGVVRVSAVYTAPERRGRGYASALVAATSQAALDAGASACTLFTDLANPTSNAIYQRIGYHPVADAGQWRFTA
ncbi:putative acetyltransferase [Actinocatenispora thailandica]|uniref:Putative acetyltransferase n=1 Tax=Actinocatenispora thailandica TaxID=227318 RepID=A0A7R7HVM1_9ACTN|nr:GNAT family N-acetyltransferase [Actinocatenispora thailandica]BCJ33756.1 putative acetyltransferase [Actinocatenispora thailandica]